MAHINLTPRWTEILPTWLMLYRQAAAGDCTDPDMVKENARKEFERMAQAADNFNDLVTGIRECAGGDWNDDAFKHYLKLGRELNEVERNTVHEED